MANIMFLVPEFKSGGAEKTISNLIKYFQMYYPEYNIYECVMRVDKSTPSYVVFPEHDARKAKTWLGKIVYKLLQIYEIKRIKKTHEIDVAISFLEGADIVNALSQNKEKIVFSLRNNPEEIIKRYSPLMQICYAYMIKNANHVVCLSESVREKAVATFKIGEDQISAIYNPIPMRGTFCEPLLIKKLHEKGKKIFITAGRLTEQKGQWNLIKAFSKVKEQINADLIILGAGELEKKLKELANNLKLTEAVHFLGYVDNAMDYMKFSDVFVFTSLYEGLGNALVEALACGKAIISTDCQYGPRELLAPDLKYSASSDEVIYAQYGILVPVGSTIFSEEITGNDIQLSQAMIKLVTEDQLKARYEMLAIKRANDFAPLEIITQWKNLIDSLL